MDFVNLCKDRFDNVKTLLCMGLDPIIENIPIKENTIDKTIVNFYFSLIDSFKDNILAVKPNIAFYEQYGIDGYTALKKIIDRAKSYNIPVILDAKRSDIGNTARAYAKAAFEELQADAITLSPYLGEDSLLPFFEYKEKGFFILARTSNKGSSDFQLQKIADKYLYQIVANKILEWNTKYSINIGAVAGATHLDELENIIISYKSINGAPLLIPGVGKQGGDYNAIIGLLKSNNYPLYMAIINSSSKINYAYKYHPNMSYLDASKIEIDKFKLK